MKYSFVILILISLLLSCESNGNKKKAVFYGSDYTTEFQTSTIQQLSVPGETIVVPFEEKNGVKYIEVSVN